MTNTKSFSYYFLNKRLHPPVSKAFKNSIILLIINKNKTPNKNKFLLVQQANLFWNLPKKGIKAKSIIEDIYTTIARNLENELGFKGVRVTETKPIFKQIAFLFDFDKQIYDTKRSQKEKAKGNPTKGKIYQLAVMEYRGPDAIPITPKTEVINHKWVDKKDGLMLMNLNEKLLQPQLIDSKESVVFNIKLFNKVMKAHEQLNTLYTNQKQFELF